jgi:hypothetical protein
MLAAATDQGVHRVSADVDGAALWFESADVALSAAPEAFASAMLLPSIARGETLTVDEPVSSIWRSNVRQAMRVFKEWWGYPEISPEPHFHPERTTRATHTALCYSGGVDSVYTLLRSEYSIQCLVFVLGYDVQLGDVTRFEAFRRSLRAAADATGARLVVIRTNLREHPAFAPISWERAHGGALAAVGHLLSGAAGQLLISSTDPYTLRLPWGSHWMTDAFWSSEKLQVLHVGAEVDRNYKLRSIADAPLARHHLRVCWENRSPSGNCSRCEKCVRSRLILADCGRLADFPVFEGEESLLADMKALPHTGNVALAYQDLERRNGLRPELRRELRKLIARSDRRRRQLKGETRTSTWRMWLGGVSPS